MDHVKSGFRRAGGWLLGLGWGFAVFWGLAEAFSPEHPSPILGYIILTGAAAIMIVTAERWKRIFPGFMIAGMLGSLLELSRGHAVNNPSVPISTATALTHLVVFGGVTALSLPLKERKLNVMDRIALLAFVASFVWAGVDTRFSLLKLFGGAFCLLLAWVYHRVGFARLRTPG